MTSRRLLWLLILISASLRLVWAASLDLGNDEAYHYLFATHPDWSYFDHPPMVALVERLGIVLSGGVASAFRLRIGFILLFAGSTWLMARLTERFYGPWAGLLAAFALNVTAYHSVAAGTFVLPDGPLLFFWLLTLDRLAVALDSGGRLTPWLGVGFAWGAAMLSKYHAIFLPVGTFLYLVLEPSARHWLRRSGPYVATAIGLALFSPVIWWNANHGWASFAFQGARSAR
ncbi:glycosyltransferase family 39 protein [Singulisphaera sp. Ch08]|uniref:Glycosyltransferase family 39 protein n=1 Tax=Singulisphaera sp. Ch08 TaxID=3120278 RepID=A0AAU7CPD3_9BACT